MNEKWHAQENYLKQKQCVERKQENVLQEPTAT